MRSNIVQDDELVTFNTDEHASPFKICGPHHDSLCGMLNDDGEKVLNASHVLFKLAFRTVGSKGVEPFGCPVCALQGFDYIGQTVLLFR